MEAGFWKSKRVLVTGHTGFKGSWLTKWLHQLGAKVLGISLDPATVPNAFSAMRCGNGIASITGDIRDLQFLRTTIAQFRPELIFHLAAQSLVREGYADPVGTYATNVMGTVHLLEAAREADGVRAVLVVTSDKCYENRNWLWAYREIDTLGGYDPYSSSKACAELVTAAYAGSYFRSGADDGAKIALATARAGNVIGGGDWARDRLIPDLVRGAVANSAISIRNPAATRPWQHVLEPLAGYLTLAQFLFAQGSQAEGAWNFGPAHGDEKTVGWMADRFTALWGHPVSWTRDSGSHPHEASLLRLDSSKARRLLGWRPAWTVDEALQATIDWYAAHYRGDDMERHTIRQINEYQALIMDKSEG